MQGLFIDAEWNQGQTDGHSMLLQEKKLLWTEGLPTYLINSAAPVILGVYQHWKASLRLKIK